MKILVIMKRFGANKDMVLQNFGRQISLFEPLARKHKIDFFCPDYKKHEDRNVKKNNINFFIRPYSILNHFRFLCTLNLLIKKNNYDIIVGATDPLLGILGYIYSKKFKIKHIYDMQDEYSCYNSYKIPLVRFFDKMAVINSDIVITVSDSLNKKICEFRKKQICTVQNGIDLGLFQKIDKNKSRKSLKLPDGKIIVYTGEISRFKGVDILMQAFRYIKKQMPNSYLLLSGKISDDIKIEQDGVIYRECATRQEVVLALNAADVAVIPNPKNLFSEYCFPYKALEYMAIGLPIVATKIGDISRILIKYKNSLCKPNDIDDLKEKIILRLKNDGSVDYSRDLKKFEWKVLADKLNNIIESL